MPRRARHSPLTPVLAVLAAGGVAAGIVLVGPASSSGGTTGREVATATRGVVQQTVSGSGNLEPAKQDELTFATSGRVTHVYVHAGRHV
ncbi:MAG TPA: hypothetical protein VGI54_04495, partial [Solirubrobacteraceae bacterium]